MSAVAHSTNFVELDAEPTFGHCKVLSDINGFLTAVAIGPETIPPSEWMKSLCSGTDTDFASEEEELLFEDVLMEHFDAILDTLAHDPESYEPDIYENPETGETTAEIWAEGFLAGMRLRGHAWKAIFRSEAGQTCFTPIALFIRGEDGSYVLDGPEVEQARAEIGDELSDAVVGVYQFFKERRRHFEGGAKLGRNDPCFCGSGKKFKRCCGSGHRR